jgi:hypothetical protein
LRDRCVSVEAAISHSIFGNSESASHEAQSLLADRRSRRKCAPDPDRWRVNLNLENSTPRDKSRATFALPKPPTARDFHRIRRCVRCNTTEFCRENASSLPAHKMDHQGTKGVSEIVTHERKTKLEIPRAWRCFVREPGVQKCRSSRAPAPSTTPTAQTTPATDCSVKDFLPQDLGVGRDGSGERWTFGRLREEGGLAISS